MHLKNDKRGESPKAGGQAVPDEELDFGTPGASAARASASASARPGVVFDRAGVHLGTARVDPTDGLLYFHPRSVFVRAPDDGGPYPLVERPDWDYWALIPMLTVHEAAAIACDIAPEYFSKSEDAREFYECHKDLIRHRRLLPTALSHIEAGALEVVSGKVRAEVFAAWANGLGWKLPARFPRGSMAKDQQAAPSASATDATAPDELGDVKRGALLGDVKRGALIGRNERQWPSMERDLKDASNNGLGAAKVAGRHGWWHEPAALDWARQRGKLLTGDPAGAAVLAVLAVRRHKM